jgi:hypothetical protein
LQFAVPLGSYIPPSPPRLLLENPQSSSSPLNSIFDEPREHPDLDTEKGMDETLKVRLWMGIMRGSCCSGSWKGIIGLGMRNDLAAERL